MFTEFVLTLIGLLFAAAEDPGNLELVQILFRHGDRTPIDPFPTDPWRYHWAEGYGQLTNIGKVQQYHLGSYFRKRYEGFINETYNCSEIVVKSTDVDRTLMSAYCNLAGLFPPKQDQKWDPKIDWQPIPVHTRPNDIDWLLKTDSPCPKFDEISEEVRRSPEMQKINDENKDLYSLLTNKTGRLITDIFSVSNVYDVLLIEKLHDLPLPDWATSKIMNQLKALHNLQFTLKFYTLLQRKLRGGPLVGEMVNNMENKISKLKPELKMFMYSAHDTTVAGFLSALNVFNNISPPYFATVLIELYSKGGNYSVKILYRNASDVFEDPHELVLPGCTSLCPFSQFKQLTAPIIPLDIQKECSESIIAGNVALISAIFGSLVGCSLLLITIGGVMYWRRNNNSYRYLNVQAE